MFSSQGHAGQDQILRTICHGPNILMEILEPKFHIFLCHGPNVCVEFFGRTKCPARILFPYENIIFATLLLKGNIPFLKDSDLANRNILLLLGQIIV